MFIITRFDNFQPPSPSIGDRHRGIAVALGKIGWFAFGFAPRNRPEFQEELKPGTQGNLRSVDQHVDVSRPFSFGFLWEGRGWSQSWALRLCAARPSGSPVFTWRKTTNFRWKSKICEWKFLETILPSETQGNFFLCHHSPWNSRNVLVSLWNWASKKLWGQRYFWWRPSGLVVGRGAVEIFLKFAYGNFAFLGDKDQSDMAKMSKGRYASSSLDE